MTAITVAIFLVWNYLLLFYSFLLLFVMFWRIHTFCHQWAWGVKRGRTLIIDALALAAWCSRARVQITTSASEIWKCGSGRTHWVIQSIQSDSLRPLPLCPTLRNFTLGSRLRRSQTRAQIHFELVASKPLFIEEYKRHAATHVSRTPLLAAAASKSFSIWEKPDYSMRKAPEGEWSWRDFSRSARDWCLISSERCGKMNMRCISTFFWDFCKFFSSFCYLYTADFTLKDLQQTYELPLNFCHEVEVVFFLVW